MAATDKLVITEKNSRHSVAGTCLKIATDILGLLTAAVSARCTPLKYNIKLCITYKIRGESVVVVRNFQILIFSIFWLFRIETKSAQPIIFDRRCQIFWTSGLSLERQRFKSIRASSFGSRPAPQFSKTFLLRVSFFHS